MQANCIVIEWLLRKKPRIHKLCSQPIDALRRIAFISQIPTEQATYQTNPKKHRANSNRRGGAKYANEIPLNYCGGRCENAISGCSIFCVEGAMCSPSPNNGSRGSFKISKGARSLKVERLCVAFVVRVDIFCGTWLGNLQKGAIYVVCVAQFLFGVQFAYHTHTRDTDRFRGPKRIFVRWKLKTHKTVHCSIAEVVLQNTQIYILYLYEIGICVCARFVETNAKLQWCS